MSSIINNDEVEMSYIPKCVDHEINDMLVKKFTDEEILAPFNQMDPRKASGIDGLSDFSCINETIIFLIPKIRELITMSNFQPISLCRVIYKVIVKILANRLKDVLPLCISHNQSAFTLGRMIHDNILIVHELMHYLQSSKKAQIKGSWLNLT
ncbi:reverse transcriptase [Gossypium australe]|uniref:Reverse transcriptase n=1 Tax=Gossypium australe TaxID=47621 RepID=A0A5B6X1U9_9ROSI|nr:reverse transcriptase [Gossypium australe]